MAILSDNWIRRMAEERAMIEPFVDGQVREDVVSYGLSSYGYDIRVGSEFKVFTDVHSVVVDPKAFDERSFVDIEGDHCIIPPNSFALARTLERFAIPEDVLVVCVGKSTYARCFRGDTRVALVDGTAPTLEEMARRAEDGEMFWGYSVGEYGRIIVSLLDAPRHVGHDALLEVLLDHGETVNCTPDHEFLLRDGRVVPADELQPGVSLMPLYRDIKRGYESVYQPLNGHLYSTHRLADEWNHRNGFYADRANTHRHHRDHDRRNNCPWNIERMAAGEHVRHHNRETFDPANREAQGERSRKAWAADDGARRERQREIARRIRLRSEITEEVVSEALNQTGSIRGAARLLDCDRSVFRRFPEVIARFKGRRTAGNHKVERIRRIPGDHDVFCLTVPEAGNFALDAGVFVRNCGIIVNVTPLEPEWRGHLTLEISNTTPLPAKIYAREGIAQLLFFQGDEVPSTTYAQRAGKYQDQEGVTLPRM